MEEGERRYIPGSEDITGYRVHAVRRGPFRLVGYTRIYRSGEEPGPPAFWDEVLADGRLSRLAAAAAAHPWVFGLGSWDPECPKGGHRHTISIEESPGVDPARLAALEPLHRQEIGASGGSARGAPRRLSPAVLAGRPYRMLKALGYRFHTREGISPWGSTWTRSRGCDVATGPTMEFWITVV